MPKYKKARFKCYETILWHQRQKSRYRRRLKSLQANCLGEKSDDVRLTEENVGNKHDSDGDKGSPSCDCEHDDKSKVTEYAAENEEKKSFDLSRAPKKRRKRAKYTVEPEEGMKLTLSWNIPEDVLRRANASMPSVSEDQAEDVEDMSIIRINVDELEEADQSVMKISVDLPKEATDDSVEEKYSDVLRRYSTLTATSGVEGANTLTATRDEEGANTLAATRDVEGANTLTATRDVEGANIFTATRDMEGPYTSTATIKVLEKNRRQLLRQSWGQDANSVFFSPFATLTNSTWNPVEGVNTSTATIKVEGANVLTVTSDGEGANILTTASDLDNANTLTATIKVEGANMLTATSDEEGANTLTTASDLDNANTLTATIKVEGANMLTATSDEEGANTLTTASDLDNANTLTATIKVEGANMLTATPDVEGSDALTASPDIESANTLTATIKVEGANTLTASPDVESANTLTATPDVESANTLTATPDVGGAADVRSNSDTLTVCGADAEGWLDDINCADEKVEKIHKPEFHHVLLTPNMVSSQEVSFGMAMSERVAPRGEESEPRGSVNSVSQPLFLMNGVVEDRPNNSKSLENGYEGVNLSGRAKHSRTGGPKPSDVIDLPQQADSTESLSQQNEMKMNQILWCPLCKTMYGHLDQHLKIEHAFLPEITRVAIRRRSQGLKTGWRDQLKVFGSKLELTKLPLDKLIQMRPMTMNKIVKLLIRIRLDQSNKSGRVLIRT